MCYYWLSWLNHQPTQLSIWSGLASTNPISYSFRKLVVVQSENWQGKWLLSGALSPHDNFLTAASSGSIGSFGFIASCNPLNYVQQNAYTLPFETSWQILPSTVPDDQILSPRLTNICCSMALEQHIICSLRLRQIETPHIQWQKTPMSTKSNKANTVALPIITGKLVDEEAHI